MMASVGPGFGSGLSVAVNPGCADVLTSARMSLLYTTDPIPKNYFGMLEPQWSAGVAQARSVWSIWLVSFNQTNETNQIIKQRSSYAGGLFQQPAREKTGCL